MLIKPIALTALLLGVWATLLPPPAGRGPNPPCQPLHCHRRQRTGLAISAQGQLRRARACR